MKKYKWIVCLLVAISLWGCGRQEIKDEGVAPREKLVFRITWKAYSGRGEAIQKIVAGFNESQDAYQVEVVSGNEDLEAIRTDLSEASVDIFMLPYRYVQVLGHQGDLHHINREAVIGSGLISQDILALGEIDHITYGVPWLSHAMALVYNQDLIKQGGIDVDGIVDRQSFELALKTIEEKTDARGIGLVGADHNDLSWMVNQFIYGSGGCLIEGGKVGLRSSESKAGLQYYRDVLSKYAQDTWLNDTGQEVMTAFRQGEIAFEIQSLWGVTDIWQHNNPFEVGVMALDKIQAHAEVGPMMLAYRAGLDADKAAVVSDFIGYMLSKEAQLQILQGAYSPEKNEYYPFRLPVRKDIIESDAFEAYEIFDCFIKAHDQASIDVPSPRWMHVKDALYSPNLHKVMAGEMTIESFFDLMEDQGNKILQGGEE